MPEQISDKIKNILSESETDFSDEFKDKLSTIFESSVEERISQEKEKLTESFEEQYKEKEKILENEYEEQVSEFQEKLDEYLDYIVKEWLEENEQTVTNTVRADISEKFMEEVKDVFENYYIEIPESRVDYTSNLEDEVSSKEKQVDKLKDQLSEQKEYIEKLKRDNIIIEESKNLSDIQYDKLNTLSNNIKFISEDHFRKQIKYIKESFLNNNSSNNNIHESTNHEFEEDETTTDDDIDPNMKKYLDILNRSIKK